MAEQPQRAAIADSEDDLGGVGRCGAIEAFVLVEDFQRFGEHGFGALVDFLERARDSPAEVDSGRSCLSDSFGRGQDVAAFAGREHNASAPAAPSAGAPRTARRRIASTSSSTVRRGRTRYSAGSAVWSMIVTASPSQSMVLRTSRP
jgi:hypothetical protein